jgi:predicted dehydrogenase
VTSSQISSLRVGIIGFGGAGTAHAGYFSCIPGCVVKKIYNPKLEGLESAQKLFPYAERHTDLDHFWADLDVVSICTPDSTHADYLVTALAHHLHVLCEKPLTDSEEGMRKIKTAVAKTDRVVACLHQMRFVPLFRKVKALLDAKELGAISYMEGYYVHNLVHRAFAYDDWRRRDNATPLVYSGCHFVDLLRWFANEEIVEVFAAANNIAFPEYPESDFNLAVLRFKSGVVGKVVVAFGTAGPQDHSIRIYGDRCSIDNNTLFNDAGAWERILHEPIIIQKPLLAHPIKGSHRSYARQLRSNLPAWLLGKIFLAARFLARRPNDEYGGRYYPVRLYEHALACVYGIEDFVQAIRQKRAPLCTVDEASKTVLACLAGVESYRNNHPVRVRTLEEVLQGDKRSAA